MAYLSVASTEIPVRVGAPHSKEEPVGNVRRAFSGIPRSRVRGYLKVWEGIETRWITRAEANTIVAALKGTPPLSCTGDMGGSFSAVVENIREMETERLAVGGVNTEHVRLSFDLLENAE